MGGLAGLGGSVSSIKTFGWIKDSLRLVRKVDLGGEQARILARLDGWRDESKTRTVLMSALPACLLKAHRME